jgi:3-isopropylmalate dehydrogenase
MTRNIDLAVIPGDGIGPEVIEQALRVMNEALAGTDTGLTVTEYPLGAAHWLETGEALNDSTLDAIRHHEAILFGAIGAAPGDTRIPSGLIERELLLKLRFTLDHAVNLRPSKLYPGTGSPLQNPGDIDFIVVREGTEGPYVGNGGVIREGTEHEIATEVSINTAHGVARVVRDAFERAAARPRHKLTLVHKHNVLVNAGHLWRRTVDVIGEEFPEVEVDYLHVDAATIFMVTDPSRFDVIVTDNLFGDILTDLAGAVTGGIGLAASGNINLDGSAPSMFEPVHGSAPDIAGQGIADPTAAILSSALLLHHLGLDDAAAAIEAVVAADVEARTGVRSTSEIGDAIVSALAEARVGA